MMKLKQRHGEVHSVMGRGPKRRVILHHTVTPTVQSAINALNSRGKLGYHYIIDRDGTIHEMVPPNRVCFHAKGYSNTSIGISFVGGGKFGYTTEQQIKASISLMKVLKQDFRFLTKVTGHKHATKSGKIDPRWKGEPANDVNWKIDREYMERIAKETGLKAEFMKG